MLGTLKNGSTNVVDFLKKGGRGYGDQGGPLVLLQQPFLVFFRVRFFNSGNLFAVKSWEGGQSMVNRDTEQDMHFNYNRRYSDAYNQGYDRGNVSEVIVGSLICQMEFPSLIPVLPQLQTKKMKQPRRYNNTNPNFGPNPFQRMQELNDTGKCFMVSILRWLLFRFGVGGVVILPSGGNYLG